MAIVTSYYIFRMSKSFHTYRKYIYQQSESYEGQDICYGIQCTLNALTQEDIQRLWLPKVIYENTDQKKGTRLGDKWEWETSVVVEKNGIVSTID